MVFIDEFRVELSENKSYARSHKKRVIEKVEKARRRVSWNVVTFLHSKGVNQGLAVEDSFNRYVMCEYIKELIDKEFKDLGIKYVIMDNLSVHKTKEVKEIFEQAGIEIIHCPPYSPECNAIEEAISKIKNEIRSNTEKSKENILKIIADAISHVTEKDAQGYIKNWLKNTMQS